MKRENPNAKVRYPFLVWSYGARASNGFIVEFPDVPGIRGESLNLKEAIRLAHLELLQKLKAEAHKVPKPGSGNYCAGIPPQPPVFARLTAVQKEAAKIDAEAIRRVRRGAERLRSVRGRQSDFPYALKAEDVLAKLLETRAADFETTASTINRWREGVLYQSAVLDFVLGDVGKPTIPSPRLSRTP